VHAPRDETLGGSGAAPGLPGVCGHSQPPGGTSHGTGQKGDGTGGGPTAPRRCPMQFELARTLVARRGRSSAGAR